MKQIDDVINNLEQIKDKSSLKVILEEYKKMYEELSEERNYRIRLIEELGEQLLEIRKNNLEIMKQPSFKEFDKRYKGRVQMAKLVRLVNKNMYTYRGKMVDEIYEEQRACIDKEFAKKFEKFFGYINEEIVCGHEYEIDNYIKSLYRKYVCEEFGHEYVRQNNGKVEVVMEGHTEPEYEFDAFERCIGLASAGSHGIPVVQCKYCGEKIYGNIFNGDIFEPDFKDKQKILLPLSQLNKECK